MKNPQIQTFYHPKMAVNSNLSRLTRNPAKSRLLMEYIERKGLIQNFLINGRFPPLSKEDFYIAHTKEMVDNFYDIGKTSRILNIDWSPEYAESVRYMTGSLYQAIKHAVQNPKDVCFSPSYGFHHATPSRGALFCAFSGQVISSMKIFYEFGLSGAYIDLDGHYGNSIDNSRDFVIDINNAISPVCGNINILSRHTEYLDELKKHLLVLRKEIIEERVHYVVFCHGADSHEWDDLACQLTTEEWIKCSSMVYQFIMDVQKETNKQIPLILTLFGGYRRDDYNSVLSLHTSDLIICLNLLCGQEIRYEIEVKPPPSLRMS
jgi:acetoin utilization deacetylase AcuC-like enzyme